MLQIESGHPTTAVEDLSGIPQYPAWREITPVDKGWSGDRKYCIVDSQGRKFLLRTSGAEQHQRKLQEFQCMVHFAKTGVNMSRPVEYGHFDHGRRLYTLLTWVEGLDAEDYLKGVSLQEQYGLGICAGKALRALHSLPPPGNLADCETRFNQKIDAKLANYATCPVRVPGDAQFLEFIAGQRALLKGRPQTWQHGDFHVGNLVIAAPGDIGVIDFNRLDVGDPWEDFNRIIFCSRVSPDFASGRINGYFDAKVPDEFFRLLALYLAVNAIGSVPWAMAYGSAEVATMLNQAAAILAFYGNFQTVVPRWYTSEPLAHR